MAHDTHCYDCGKETLIVGKGTDDDFYMVHDKVWKSATNSKHGFLCIECLEKRLKRKLTKLDFTECPLNDMNPKVQGIIRKGEASGVTPETQL